MKTLTKLLLISLGWLLPLGNAFGHVEGECLGPFCFGSEIKRLTNFEAHKKIYGQGKQTGDSNGPSFCYFLPKENHWLLINTIENDHLVVEAKLTDENLCEAKFSTKKELPILKTRKGITLGDSSEAVLKAYGEPDRKKSDEFFYETKFPEKELFFMKINLVNNKVRSILVSASP